MFSCLCLCQGGWGGGVTLPVNFSKPGDVSFKHFSEDLHVKVLLHTVLGAKILQDASDVGQKNIIQCAASGVKTVSHCNSEQT